MLAIVYNKQTFMGELIFSLLLFKNLNSHCVSGKCSGIYLHEEDLYVNDLNLIVNHLERLHPYPSITPVSPLDRAVHRNILQYIVSTVVPMCDQAMVDENVRSEALAILVEMAEYLCDNLNVVQSSGFFDNRITALDIAVYKLFDFYKALNIFLSPKSKKLVYHIYKIHQIFKTLNLSSSVIGS